MKKGFKVGGAIVVLTLAVFLSRALTQQLGTIVPLGHPAGSIGLGLIDFDGESLVWPRCVEGFIETGSSSETCFATLREAMDPWKIQALFCAHRELNGRHGIDVTILFNEDVLAEDVLIGVTVYQEHARYYATPVNYPGD